MNIPSQERLNLYGIARETVGFMMAVRTEPRPRQGKGPIRTLQRSGSGTSKPQEPPCAIITGGQPDSGKSGLMAMATGRFRESGYVLVDADKMRAYHPDYTQLMCADDCGPWTTRRLCGGVVGRRNIIIDQTSREPAAMEKMVQVLSSV